MLAGIDTDRSLTKPCFEIEENDTGLSVSAKCVKFGMELVRQLLKYGGGESHAIPVIEQDLARREYFGGNARGWLVGLVSSARDVSTLCGRRIILLFHRRGEPHGRDG